MNLTFVNVGYGEAILIDCKDPSFRQGHFVMLIDGGSARDSEFEDRSSGRVPLEEYLRSSGLDHIDIGVLTHIHEDHMCGFKKAVELFPPSEIWQTFAPGFFGTSGMRILTDEETEGCDHKFVEAWNDYCSMCQELKETRFVRKVGGDAGSLCSGLTYSVLGPSAERAGILSSEMEKAVSLIGTPDFSGHFTFLDKNMNNYSMILLLEYEGKRIFLPGDTNCFGYQDLNGSDIHADLFKVGHHGQIDGVAQEQLLRISPSYVVCCASSDRRYNSAHPEMMNMISDSGAELCFSDCPDVQGCPLHPHSSLVFDISGKGISYRYV